MENAQTILVVILSGFLAVFLLLGIVLLALIIKIAKNIKHITEKAEQVVDQAEHIGDFFKKATGSFAFARLISNIANSVFNHEEKKRKKRGNKSE